MALVKTEEVLLYEPTFDENTGIYTDVSPYKRHERNRSTYKCGCDHSFRFSTTTQFKSHIKSNKHKEFVKDYKYNKRSDEETRRELKECRIKIEILERKNRLIVKKDMEIIKEINKLKDETANLMKEKESYKKKKESLRRSMRQLIIQNKHKDEEIERLSERVEYLESQLEDSEYKEVINFETT